MAAKAKEAELNARVLSLESQIHWLGEQNAQLQVAIKAAHEQQAQPQTQPAAGAHQQEGGAESGGAANAAVGGEDAAGGGEQQAAALSELASKCTGLEGELRKARRAEQKLQAMLFRWGVLALLEIGEESVCTLGFAAHPILTRLMHPPSR